VNKYSFAQLHDTLDLRTY